ncbi:MAX gene-associated protein [Elysia marginata]|uniref:MAX gene-associated protein n=1 Tax=Elysia marginata TaxID=1093978 RepID=A0AAV4H376_9GAST|nr:MAX gene-associated protein [Elysia marginata]
MARTKKQTLENASERKRLIQEEILRESLAAKQKAAAAAADTSQSSASPPATSRSKGKHRPRHPQPSPNEVASHASPSSAHTGTPVARGSSSSKRRKADALRAEFSKSNDSVRANKRTGQATVSRRESESRAASTAGPLTKGNMPKAVLCIPDIYSSPSNSSGGDSGKSQGTEETPQALSHVLDSCTVSTHARISFSGSRNESPESLGQEKQKSKRGFQESVKASLMSLKAASEMVREEKRRKSRQRSPSSSKEHSPGSQNPSPERRSPRRQSPSNSTDSVEFQQRSVTKKKKTKKKAQLEERPKINIFTDNIGVELGKRVRSPRRLSEDMIALPIFSVRRWSSSTRETSYIAEKSDGDAAPAKLSPEDQDSFKPPHAVSPNPLVTKGFSNVPARKKGNCNDKPLGVSFSASDNEEKEDGVRKIRSQKVKNKLPVMICKENSSAGEDIDGLKAEDNLQAENVDSECNVNQAKKQAKFEADGDCKSSCKDVEEKLSWETKKQSSKKKQDKVSSGGDHSVIEPLDSVNKVGNETNDPRENSGFDKCIPDDSAALPDKIYNVKDDCKDTIEDRTIASALPLQSDTQHEVQTVLDPISTKISLSPDKASISKTEDCRKQEESVQKSPSKKSKSKSLVRTASGERKKKQREKMKIGDEVLTSICRDIMSGVFITPNEGLENKVQAFSKDSDETQTFVSESMDVSKSHCSITAPVTMSPSSGLFNQAKISMGVSTQKDTGASSNIGLLQPARNILTSSSSGHSASIISVVSSVFTSTITHSTCVSAVSSSSSSHTIVSCSSQSTAIVPISLSLSSAKPVFSHQSPKVNLSSSDSMETKNSTYSLNSSTIDASKASFTQALAHSQSELLNQAISNDNITKHSISKELVCDYYNEPASQTAEKQLKNRDTQSSEKESPGVSDVSNVTDLKTIHNDGTRLNAEAQEIKKSPKVVQSMYGGIEAVPHTPASPPDYLPVQDSQIKTVINTIPAIETAEATSSNISKVTSKESPQSSLLCAMLVGGSEVADTYEKSKPSVVGSSSETSNETQQNIPSTSTVQEKIHSKQHSFVTKSSGENNEEHYTCTEDSATNAYCKVLSEKGDAPSSDLIGTKPSAETESCNDNEKENMKQTITGKTKKKNLKIDISSKLKRLDETVLKLLDIDVEESFLDDKYEESRPLDKVKQDLPSFDEGEICSQESLEKVLLDKGIEEKLKAATKAELDEKVSETPLYGVISNLATRLKGKTLTVDVEEMLSSCPKHMLKICSEVDEAARWSTLKLRLKEELEESKTCASAKIDESELEAKPSESNVALTEMKFEGCSRDMPTADNIEEPEPPHEKGAISPQMTSSSSTNNSLCDLDPDAMTSAVNDACMDVSMDCHMKEIKEELVMEQSPEVQDLDKVSPEKHLIKKSKTFEFPDRSPHEHHSTSLRRVNSSPQLKVESSCENVLASESFLENSKFKDLQVSKSKLGSKIPVPGTSYASKPVRKSWRTPRIILQPKPLTVLSELEESSASEKNIFTCPNLQKYLNVPSNRVIVPPHKRKEMQVLDERAQKDEEERAARQAERSDKERAEEMVNLEYLKYEPDFDEVEGLLFMSFSCEAELTAHSRVEKALEWDKDDTMLRIAQAKAFEEAKQLKAGMEAVKFKHLRGQHMRWKKYRRLYSNEVKSILNGAPSSVDEHMTREAASRARSKKSSDITKIKNWKSKTGIARQQLQIHRQKAREWRLARKEKLQNRKLSKSVPLPTQSSYISPASLMEETVSNSQVQSEAEQAISDQSTPQLNKFGLEPGTGLDTIFLPRSKRRTGFSHQKEHKQLFKELNMDWEDRMIHRKLGGWSLKGNRPKAFSQAAHRREEKQKMMLGDEGSSNTLDIADTNPSNAVDALSTDSSNTPSRVSSGVDVSSPSKDDLDSQKKKKSLKLVYPLLSERMVRIALTAMINLGGSRSGRRKNDDVDGSSVGHSRRNNRKSRHKLKCDELPALRPIFPHPANSHVSPVMLTDGAENALRSPSHNTEICETPPKVQSTTSPRSSLVAAGGSPVLSYLSRSDSNVATPSSSLSLVANVNSSAPSSPAPLQASSATNTPPTSLTLTDTKEDAMVMEGVDTVGDVVSSPSIADSASTKSCGKPGCRYGCICHICLLSASSTSPVGKSLTSTCDKEYCRLGCICDSLDPEKPIPEMTHCGQPSCMLSCTCSSKARTGREPALRENIGLSVPEKLNKRKAKGKHHRNREHNNGSEFDNIPYLPSMKRKPIKPGERFSNLPQREKTHRSAKNLDAITRKAMMLYETSEIYCEKTERQPRKDMKDVASGLSGVPFEDDFSYLTSAMSKPVIEIDSLPDEDNLMQFESKQEGENSRVVDAASYSEDLGLPGYPDDYDPSATDQNIQSFLDTRYEDYLATRHKKSISIAFEEDRQTVPVWEQSAHRRKRKSHPLSSEIFTLSTCARTQPYNYKRKSREPGTSRIASDTATSNIMTFTPIHTHSGSESRADQPVVSTQANSTESSNVVAPSSGMLPVVPQVSSTQMLGKPHESSQVTPKGARESLIPISVYNHNSMRTGNGEGSGRNRYQQPWHTSMVCLKARGPPPKKKRVTSQPTTTCEDEEEDVQEEDEVKLLEFLANCNWEGARKEILGKVAQCLTRGQYPQPRTMKICEFLVEILPKAHKPSVIPEELRKKLPGKMYSIRVRVTRREILPKAPSDLDSQVIDLSDSSPVKTNPIVNPGSIVPSSLQISSQHHTLGVSGVSNLSANVGISGLSRMRVTSRNDLTSNQQKSVSAPNSRRTSTEATTAAPLKDPSVTDYHIAPLIQVQKKGASLQAMVSVESTQDSVENGKSFVTSSVSLALPSDSTITSVTSTSVPLGVSTLPSTSTTKSLQGPKSIKLKPIGSMNPQARSLLKSKAAASVSSGATSTSNILPFYYTVKPDDLKYMKIQGKDGLMQVVGVSNDNKALVTLPVSSGQKIAAGDQPQLGSMKTCALPFITVPVCGPHGPKMVPIIPSPLPTQVRAGGTSPVITSSSVASGHHPILVRFPNSTQAFPQAIVKGPVLLRPMGSQPPASKLQPLLIPSSSRSLLSTHSTTASKDKTCPHPKDVSPVLKQSVDLTTTGSSKTKETISNDEVILTFDAAHLKQKKKSQQTTSEASQQSPSSVKKQDQLGLPPTTSVTPSLVGPIMSLEESPPALKDPQNQDQTPRSSGDNSSEGGKQEDGALPPPNKPTQQGNTAASKMSSEQMEEQDKNLGKRPVALSESKQKMRKGPNLYIPNTKQETSNLIMVYPPANTLTKAKSPVVPVTQQNSATVSSGLKIQEVHSIITTGSSSIVTESTVEQLSQSQDILATSSTYSACSSTLSTNTALKVSTSGSVAACQQQSSLLSLQSSSHYTQTLTGSFGQLSSCTLEVSKHGVKRRLSGGEDKDESNNSTSGTKRGSYTYPDAHSCLPQVEDERDNTRSSSEARMGLNLVSPSLTTTSSTINDRPISSMSTSLSTGSSDNLHIMLSSDESDIDVGETEDPKSIMALRENAERALENDHGYQRMDLSDSESSVSLKEAASEVLKSNLAKIFKVKRKDIDPTEHNMRERIRRSKLKDLFLNLQRNVCGVTGAKFDRNLSRAKTLQQVLNFLKRERWIHAKELCL